MSDPAPVLPLDLPPLIPHALRDTHRVAHAEVVLRFKGPHADEEDHLRRLSALVHREFGADALTTTIDGEVIAP